MRHSLKTGFSFGLTSGIITTLGLLVGLYATDSSVSIIIAGIATIAIADSFSDALGIHVAEEAENKHTTREIWESTASTFFTKLFVALTFIVPIALLSLSVAVVAVIFWGLSLLAIFSFYIAKRQKNACKVIAEHLIIAIIVIAITFYTGRFINAVLIY